MIDPLSEFKYELEKKSDKSKFKFGSQHAQPTPKMSFIMSATILQDRNWKVEFSFFGVMLVELRHCQCVSIVFYCETLWSFWTPSNAAHVPRWSLVRLSLIFAGWPPPTHTHTLTVQSALLEGTTVIVLVWEGLRFSDFCLIIYTLCYREEWTGGDV